MMKRCRHVVMVIIAVCVGGGVGVLFGSPASDARPILQPCSYDQTCITTTRVRASTGIDNSAMLGPNGRTVDVTGHLDCDRGERYAIEVTVSQGDVDAYGRRGGSCDGVAPWSVHAATGHGEELQAGPAEVCAHYIAAKGDVATVGRNWCKTVTLV
jgi:hypothetical protein